MPELKAKTTGRGRRTSKREFVFSDEENKILKRIGRKIVQELNSREKSSEWLAFSAGIARSTLHEIIAGRANLRVLTLNEVAQALDYANVFDFMKAC